MDEEHAALIVEQPPKKSRKWMWMSASAALLVCVGVVSFIQRPRVTMVQRIKGFHSKAMKIATRILQAEDEQKWKFDYLSTCEGADAPDAMSFEATMEQDETAADDAVPAYTITFMAKEGKQDDLVRLFKNVRGGIIDHVKDEHGEDAGSEAEKAIVVEAGDSNDVVITLIAPQEDMEQKLEKDTEVAFEKAPVKFSFTVKFGRTVSEMLEHRDESLLLVSDGQHFSVSTTVGTVLLDVINEDVPRAIQGGERPIFEMLDALKSVDFSVHDVYDKDKIAAVQEVPTLGQALDALGQAGIQHIPASIRDPLDGLDELSAGIKAMSIVGLPDKFKIDVKMNNFRVAPLLKELLSDIIE